MTGRKKTAAEIEASGNSGAHSKADLAARAKADAARAALQPLPIGEPPDYLSPSARKAWTLAAPSLRAIHLLAAPDRIAFARYCGWLAEFFELDRQRKGKVVQTTKSRAVKMQRLDRGFQARLMLDKRLFEYETAFGMNPASRQAILARLASGFATSAPSAKTAATEERRSPVGCLNTGSKPPRLQ